MAKKSFSAQVADVFATFEDGTNESIGAMRIVSKSGWLVMTIRRLKRRHPRCIATTPTRKARP